MAGSWVEERVGDGTADIFDLPASKRPRGGVLFLHDLDQATLQGNDVYGRLLEQHGLVGVCPHGDASWWLDRVWPPFDPKLTPEHYLLNQVVPFFASRWGLSPRSVALCGNGAGGQAALRLAFRHPKTFQVVAGIASLLDFHDLYHEGTALDEMYDSKEQCRQDTALLHVDPVHHPAHILFCADASDGRCYRGNDRLHEKLGALGIAHTFEATSTGQQGRQYFDQMAERTMSFLAEALEQQGRRLL